MCSRELSSSDAYTIFKLVAGRGGYRATCDRRAWLSIAREWQLDFSASAKNTSKSLRAAYKGYMLQYERHVSAGCPTVTKRLLMEGGEK